jgi:hypothetical protein
MRVSFGVQARLGKSTTFIRTYLILAGLVGFGLRPNAHGPRRLRGEGGERMWAQKNERTE